MSAVASDAGLDVVVVNYRTPYDLRAFVESYLLHRPRNVLSTLWICNVEPREVDITVAAELQKQCWAEGAEVRYMDFLTNVGYAHAVNHAVAEGTREAIGIFNADVVLRQGALQRCFEGITQHRDWGVLGPGQVNERGLSVHPGIFGTHRKPEWRGWLCAPAYDTRDDAVTVVGSAYFTRRDVWDELFECQKYRDAVPDTEGAFLPTRHYYEETWHSYHASAHGYKVVYFGEVEIVHKWHASSDLGGWADQQMGDSRELFRRACDAHGIEHD